jgi:hypothetical protein
MNVAGLEEEMVNGLTLISSSPTIINSSAESTTVLRRSFAAETK